MKLSQKISRYAAWSTMFLFFVGIGIFNIQVNVDHQALDSSVSLDMQETQAQRPITNTSRNLGEVLRKAPCSRKTGGRCKTGKWGIQNHVTKVE